MRNLEEWLFWEIFFRHHAVRSELAGLFDVSAATISRSVNVLLSKDLVVDIGVTPSQRGRRPTLLQVNPELARLGGIEFDRDRITAVVTDTAGNLLGRGSAPASAVNTVERTLADSKAALEIAVADAGVRYCDLARVGVGHTGLLDVESGVCLDWQTVPHWKCVPLRDSLAEALSKEITFDDRTRAVALAHHVLWSENRRHRSAIYVYVGTGIGAGIFVDGRMLRGTTCAGGEVGHMVIDRAGPLCACGKRGCVEAFASLGATLAYVRSELEAGVKSSLQQLAANPAHITVEMLVAAARQSDLLATTALRRAAEALGTAIANSVHLLNPSLIVLVGKFPNIARDLFLDVVTGVIERECFETMSRDLEIRIAPTRKDAAAVGCALLAAVDVAKHRVQQTLFTPRE